MKQGEKLPAPEVKPEEQPAQVPAELIQETPQVQEQAPLTNPDNE
jgi:hypothetical protein